MNHTLGTFQYDVDMLNAVEGVLKSNWISPGPKVQEFEERFSALHGNSYGVMVNSGTDALRIALLACKEKFGWKDGDSVICPSVTFVATVNTILQAGLTPYLVDVSMYDCNLNPDALAWRLKTSPDTTHIKAVIPVHIAGNPCNMDRILEIAQEFKLKVIEDSCEAMGIPEVGRGDVTCFSFYVAHLLTTGVGGMAVTRDPDLRDLMWSYANHGRRKAKEFIFDRIGYSSRPTEFEAALGLAQLPKLASIIEQRRERYEHLYDCLNEINLTGDRSIWHLGLYWNPKSSCMFFPILLSSPKISKRDLMAHLGEHGVETRDLLPLTSQPCYSGMWDPDNYFQANRTNLTGFYIGCHQDLSMTRLDQTIALIQDFLHTHEVTRETPKEDHEPLSSAKAVQR